MRSDPLFRPGDVGLVSSRLGRDVQRHRRVAEFLHRSARDVRRRGGRWWIAAGSAIEPWALRASDLYGVSTRIISAGKAPGDLCVRPRGDNVDAALIHLADRVDAVFVRRNGRIDRLMQRRLIDDPTWHARVGIWDERNDASGNLVMNGAVGWYLYGEKDSSACETSDTSHKVHLEGDERLDGWLLHCTRGFDGPWPGETESQYRDEILLAPREPNAPPRDHPLATLRRILRSGKLVTSAVASKRDAPVVCFSQHRIDDLIARRTFRSHLGRWDYEPYGIAIDGAAAGSLGIQPVRYLHDGDRIDPQVPSHLTHPVGKTFDWREEREWRTDRDVHLSDLPSDLWRPFALKSSLAMKVLQPWSDRVLWLRPGSGDSAAGREAAGSKSDEPEADPSSRVSPGDADGSRAQRRSPSRRC